MKQQSIVASGENREVHTSACDREVHTSACGVKIDKAALALALADVRKAREEESQQTASIATLGARVEELDVEIGIAAAALSATPDASWSIERIKQFADEQLQSRFRLDALCSVKDDLLAQIKGLQDGLRRYDHLHKDCRLNAWRVVYEGLQQTIDKEMLGMLIAAGWQLSKPPHVVLDELCIEGLRESSAIRLVNDFNLSEVI